jgi:hypothetical protein
VTNGAFATVALAVILPVSLMVGGWIGVVATLAAVITTGRLLIDSYDTGRAGSDHR